MKKCFRDVPKLLKFVSAGTSETDDKTILKDHYFLSSGVDAEKMF